MRQTAKYWQALFNLECDVPDPVPDWEDEPDPEQTARDWEEYVFGSVTTENDELGQDREDRWANPHLYPPDRDPIQLDWRTFGF